MTYSIQRFLDRFDEDERYIRRAAAHAAAPAVLRPAQRFDIHVTDLHVARVMLAVERGARIRRGPRGHWTLATVPGELEGSALAGMGNALSTVVQEMIRTGLMRDWRDPRTGEHVLIPAHTHLRVRFRTDGQRSLCHFVGEGMGPMRARLVDHMELVDCHDCEIMAIESAICQL